MNGRRSVVWFALVVAVVSEQCSCGDLPWSAVFGGECVLSVGTFASVGAAVVVCFAYHGRLYVGCNGVYATIGGC